MKYTCTHTLSKDLPGIVQKKNSVVFSISHFTKYCQLPPLLLTDICQHWLSSRLLHIEGKRTCTAPTEKKNSVNFIFLEFGYTFHNASTLFLTYFLPFVIVAVVSFPNTSTTHHV